MPDTRTPDLEELLNDPVMTAVMRRDGVSRQEVRDLMVALRSRLTHGSSPQLAA